MNRDTETADPQGEGSEAEAQREAGKGRETGSLPSTLPSLPFSETPSDLRTNPAFWPKLAQVRFL